MTSPFQGWRPALPLPPGCAGADGPLRSGLTSHVRGRLWLPRTLFPGPEQEGTVVRCEVHHPGGSSGKVLEVVEDEQEQAPEVAAEFYPLSLNGSPASEPTEAASPTETTPGSAPSNSQGETAPPGNGSRVSGGNGFGKPRGSETSYSPAPNKGNGSAASSEFTQLRNEFLPAARRVATTKKQAIGEMGEWASAGVFKYGDVGRMTEADTPKLRAANDLVASILAGAPR